MLSCARLNTCLLGEGSEEVSFYFGKEHIIACYSPKPTSSNRTKFDTEHEVDASSLIAFVI